jgi:hypothetical protein
VAIDPTNEKKKMLLPKKNWSLLKFFKQRPKNWLLMVTKFNDQKFDD